MNRRHFVRSGTLATGMALLTPAAWARAKGSGIRFGICTDVHQDIMHDADIRLKSFLKVARSKELDFVIDLGDFCFPIEANRDFVKLWQSSELETFNVIGNHDLDVGTKADYMNFVGMQKRYYSFDKGPFHFIVLDPNNLLMDGKYIPYAHGNFYKPMHQRAHLDPEQLEWLKKDLARTNRQVIVFSHQSIEHPKACQNGAEVRQILEEANTGAGRKKVIAAFSGHDHTDYVKEINGIHYIQINSMSNQWVGKAYKCPERYSDEINKRRPSLQYTVPYKDPLFAIVTIDRQELIIDGISSEFVKPGPKEIGVAEPGTEDLPLRAKVSDYRLKLQ